MQHEQVARCHGLAHRARQVKPLRCEACEDHAEVVVALAIVIEVPAVVTRLRIVGREPQC